MAATWDPTQYLIFGGHRLRPALELLARIPHRTPTRVTDLGCGAGNVTRFLRERWPEAELSGIDTSPEMLAAAAKEEPGMSWRQESFASWEPEQPQDVIYSNAALHWEGNHETLFARLFGFLAPGGVLAVQMPRNFGEPSHTSMRVAAAEGPWSAGPPGERLAAAIRPDPVDELGFYYNILAPLAAELELWETRTLQVLSGENPVAEFTKGTWLKPMLDVLEEPHRSGFEAAYRRLVLAAYPPREDGLTLFPFNRLFMLATR